MAAAAACLPGRAAWFATIACHTAEDAGALLAHTTSTADGIAHLQGVFSAWEPRVSTLLANTAGGLEAQDVVSPSRGALEVLEGCVGQCCPTPANTCAPACCCCAQVCCCCAQGLP